MRPPSRPLVWPRIVAVIALTLSAALVSAPGLPNWWTTRGVLQLDGAGNPVAPNDFAALNQGQVKNLGSAAFDELEAKLIGGAGPGVRELMKSWFQTDTAGNFILNAQ